MKKYLIIAYLGIKQVFVYRLSFFLWRIRNIFAIVFVYFLWNSIMIHRTQLFSYSHETLITYILAINLISSFIMGTRTSEIANDILSGDIANDFLKPISYFKYALSKEIADKGINFFFSVIEVVTLILIFKPSILIQTNLLNYLFFIIALVLGVVISFFISLCLSCLAFWSNDIWAPRFIYITITTMLAGSFFPLDILPKFLYNLLLLTPFPYLMYLPTKIFVNGISPQLIFPVVMAVIWAGIMLFASGIIWKSGVKNYNAYGR